MRKIGIGFKIATGFGLLIVIIILLGNLAIYNMNQVGKGAGLLSNAYIPEVDVAHEMERNAYEAMYHHRAFTYNNDPMELKLGNDSLAQVDAGINMAKQLVAKHPRLVKLGQGLAVIEKSLAGYRQQMEKTIENKRALAGSLIDLEISSEDLNGNINDYLDNQYEKLRYEYRSGATYDAKIKRLRKIVYANKVHDIAKQVRIAIYKAQAMRNPDMLSGTSAKFIEIDDMLSEAEAITLGEDNRERLKKVKEAVAQYRRSIDKMSALTQSDATIMIARHKFADELLKASQKTAMAGVNITKDISEMAVGDMTKASYLLVAGLAVAVILGILISFFITRMVIIPVKVTAKAVSKAARGDFTYRVREKYMQKSDELSQMLRDVQKMTESLSDTVRGVIHSAGIVSNAANEISTGNQDLSQRTQEQASSIQETASSLEEMTASVRTNAENSQQANSLARRTAEMAREGGLAVEHTIAAMADVTKSSSKIADIIDVVNEIAFQTNLLALNAAVEAARAGEAGRGFAVVAGEVRNLAGRSANAAKEIQSLITDSREKVELGNNLVTSSGELLGEIINNVQDVADTVAEITAASQEQARGIDEVNKAVIQMDEVIQRNATLVEEAASSSEEMASAAQDLLLQMGQFRIEGGDDLTTGLDLSQGYASPPKAAPKKAEPKPAASQAQKTNSANDDFFDGVDLEGFEEF